jgi:cytochrome c peroxidase
MLRRGPYVVGAALLLVAGLLLQVGAHGQSTRIYGDAALPAAQEPITPIPSSPALDPRKVALGARLFGDPRLSHDGHEACSSCHDVSTNGADARRFDPSDGHGALALNTPTVFDAALSFRLDWEGDIPTLEDQAEQFLEDPQTMATTAKAATAAVAAEAGMPAQFQQAYGHPPDRASLLNAIATYERSLLTPGSAFDRWLSGDPGALTPQAVEGYQFFKAFGCASCHQGVNVGGNLSERSGVFHPVGTDPPVMLRVPSLRNVAVTAPYFHDGSAATLDEAVRRMGFAQLDRHLTDEQAKAIVAFLDSLTGTYGGHPLSAPP